ncbi:hypothetical protein EMEDMD4_150053 [Sinorhizobium medicae]|uniref:Uncharacterized protein n=1 Tax=Sinorhizobium medicae TaxID=110321 RepID=A0A508WSG4_9HYPH|nr:hypothetical protein EMEDMD4_150053 [Sinorhizobium medicae]
MLTGVTPLSVHNMASALEHKFTDPGAAT